MMSAQLAVLYCFAAVLDKEIVGTRTRRGIGATYRCCEIVAYSARERPGTPGTDILKFNVQCQRLRGAAQEHDRELDGQSGWALRVTVAGSQGLMLGDLSARR